MEGPFWGRPLPFANLGVSRSARILQPSRIVPISQDRRRLALGGQVTRESIFGAIESALVAWTPGVADALPRESADS